MAGIVSRLHQEAETQVGYKSDFKAEVSHAEKVDA